ncbi:substrate-binding domain-containing protein [Actinopolymorpha pittospori]|uniref:Ca-activated chloride channel family protein n=1 Tax=Actinopolymorpha pittospori TaxID=648752 RepID=A0A927MV23_9ACTN|nr:Ca-activated chloride channel family protein [Actinopolymorpha pittospori]
MPIERRRVLGVITGTVLVGATAVPGLVRALGDDEPAADGVDKQNPPIETIRVNSSTEKAGVMREFVRRYNDADRVVGKLRARVVLDAVTSGAMKIALASGVRNPPHVWLPTSSMWLRLLEYEGHGDLLLTKPAEVSSIARSTLVIAMPQSVAEALANHGARLDTWADVLALAQSGWSAYGMPNWGNFILGRDNAETSTSGLAATVATYVAAPGDLTEERLDDPEVVSFVHGIESSVSLYGNEAVQFMQQIYEAEQAQAASTYRPYIDAIVIQEQMVYLYNRGAPNGEPARMSEERRPRNPLRTVYPKDGTLELDHPFVVLASANVAQRAVAEDFRAFLAEDEQQRRLAELGFRPHEGAARPTAQLVEALGTPEDQRLTFVRIPDGKLLTAMLDSWDNVRRRARVLLVLDVSGSMNDIVRDPNTAEDSTKLELVKPAAKRALDLLDDDDEVGLWTFSSNPPHTEEMPIRRVGDIREQLKSRVQGLTADGNTALYQTADDASRLMQESADPKRINAIVLLSDGQNTEPYPGGPKALLAKLNPHGKDTSVRIFTVPYGHADNADIDTLAQIAKLTKAAQYDARDPLDVNDAFVRVFRNFG